MADEERAGPAHRAGGRRIGLVLGGGGARGWAHIGVLQELAALGLRPDVVVGASIGALVGAIHAAGRLDELAAFVPAIRLGTILGYLDVRPSGGGLFAGERVASWLAGYLGAVGIEALTPRFGAVATDVESGRAVWFTEGEAAVAVRASIAMPGFFPPVRVGGHWLADGGMVDPEPVGFARALGAEAVLAVRLNGRPTREAPLRLAARASPAPARRPWFAGLAGRRGTAADAAPGPRYFDVMANTVDIMTGLVAQARAETHPPDLLLCPRVAEIGVLSFHRAEAAIAAGREAVREARPELEALRDGRPGVDAPAAFNAGPAGGPSR